MNDKDQKDNAPETPDPETGTQDEDGELDIRDTDILFECPKCGKSMVIDYRGAGLTIPCTDCKHPVDVPIPKGMDLTDLDSSPADQGVRVIQMRELLSDAQRTMYAQDNLIESLRAEIESANRRAEATEKRFQNIRREAEVIQRAIEQMGRIINDTGARRSTTEHNG